MQTIVLLDTSNALLQLPPPPTHTLHLNGNPLHHLDPELRLRRLCAWVLEADRLGLPYQLSLGALHIPSGTGPGHRRQCLDALALWSPT